MALVALAVVLVGAAMAWGLDAARSGSTAMFLAIAGAYVVLAGVSVARMAREGTLSETLRPRSGDLAIGGLLAALLYGGATLFAGVLAPRATPREGWLVRLYLQIGDMPQTAARLAALHLAIAAIGAMEEIVWRGMVQPILEAKVGTRRAWIVAAVLYAAAHVPTLWALRVKDVGPNPLLFLAALGCGLAWGACARVLGRLAPAMFSHALFSWAIAAQFPLWQLARAG